MPRAAATVALDRRLPPAEAARRAVATALARMEASAAFVLSRGDPEAVHHFRVAVRRLRATLRAYRKVLDPRFEARLRPELAWITRVSGAVRDLDVLATTTLPAIAAAAGRAPGDRFLRRLATRREDAMHRLRAALESRRHAAMSLAIARGLEAPRERAGPRGASLARLARKSVKRRFRAVRAAAGSDPAALGPAARHRLRIAAKKLRYGMEVFASLWPKRAVRPVEDALSALQDSLGRANDAAVATRLLRTLAAPAPFATFARGWLAGEIEAARVSLPRQLDDLDRARRAWKRHASRG